MTPRRSAGTNELPDDERHWDALAGRVVATVRTADTTLGWLGTARPGWTVAAILVLIGLVSLVSAGRATNSTSLEPWTRTFAPSDSVGQAMVVSNRPPDIAGLVLPAPAGGAK